MINHYQFSSLCAEEQHEVINCLEENEGRVTVHVRNFKVYFQALQMN